MMKTGRLVRLSLGAAVFLAVAAMATPASAYVRTRTTEDKKYKPKVMRWDHSCIDLDLYTGDPPADLTESDVVRMTKAAAGAWSQSGLSCTELKLEVRTVAEASHPTSRMDGINSVAFKRADWTCPAQPTEANPCIYDPRALAITSVYARRSDGVIVDADVELNAVNFLWADVAADPRMRASRYQDLQNVLTHELGHLVGFDHNCWDERGTRPLDEKGAPVPSCQTLPFTSELRAATMFASAGVGDTDKRTLEADDRKAVCDVFPADGGLSCVAPPPPPVDDGGCTYLPAGAAGKGRLPFGLGLLALSLVSFLRRRR